MLKIDQNFHKSPKLHWQNFESEKLAHKICAKNAKNCAKFANITKYGQKKAKTIKKLLDNPKISTPAKKLALTTSADFSISV